MGNAIAFAKGCVDRIVSAMPNVCCRYEHHSGSYTHFIEVIPSAVYKFDEGYLALEEKITEEFDQCFFGEYLCFVTADSYYRITNPSYVSRGHSFVPKVVYQGIPPLSNASFAELDVYFAASGNEAVYHQDVVMLPAGRGCKVTIHNSMQRQRQPIEIKNVTGTPYGVSLF